MRMVESLISILRSFGYILVVSGVMAENLGLPIPGELLVLLASSAAASAGLSTGGIIVAATLGAWIGDHLSYFMGRKAGPRLIDLYCRVTLCSTHCSSLAERFYRRRGTMTLLFARYVVGLRALAVPMAGMSGIAYRRFAVFDLAGSLLWAALVTLGGRLFGKKLLPWVVANRNFGTAAGALFLTVILAVFLYKLWKIKRYGRAHLAQKTPRSAQDCSLSGPGGDWTVTVQRATVPGNEIKDSTEL